ncbi:MAG: helicase HerA domain-containing protein, partial [Candidatus Dormibacteraceae bacterium]
YTKKSSNNNTKIDTTHVEPLLECANGSDSFAADDTPVVLEPEVISSFGTEEQAESPRQSLRVVLGDGPTHEVTWCPSTQGSPHLFITGIPGQGKSWTVMRLLIELARQGVPSLVFDFHGQLAATNSAYSTVARPVILSRSQKVS